jgi:hypothetical protein
MEWLVGYLLGMAMNIFLFVVLLLQKNGMIRIGLLCYMGGYIAGMFIRIILTLLGAETALVSFWVILPTNLGSLAATVVFLSHLLKERKK